MQVREDRTPQHGEVRLPVPDPTTAALHRHCACRTYSQHSFGPPSLSISLVLRASLGARAHAVCAGRWRKPRPDRRGVPVIGALARVACAWALKSIQGVLIPWYQVGTF